MVKLTNETFRVMIESIFADELIAGYVSFDVLNDYIENIEFLKSVSGRFLLSVRQSKVHSLDFIIDVSSTSSKDLKKPSVYTSDITLKYNAEDNSLKIIKNRYA